MLDMPHSSDMERCVIGCALFGEEALAQVLSILPDSSYFYEPRHRDIYAAVCDLNRRNLPVDSVSLAANLQERGKLDQVGGLAELLSMREGVPLVSRAEYYAKVVYEKALMRRIIGLSRAWTELCYEEGQNSESIIALATKELYDLSQDRQQGSLERIDSIMRRTINELSELARDENPQRKRLMTGYANLDHTLGGFGKGTLNILAARPGVGKSAFALNIAQNAAFLYNKSVAIFSLEMSKEEIAQRFLASAGKLNARLFRNFAKMDDKELERLTRAAGSFAQKHIYVDDIASTSPMEVLARSRQKKLEGHLDLIIIDYLQLMTMKGGRSSSRQQEVSELSRFLKLLAKDLDVPVLALSQLNRDMEKRQEGSSEVRPPQLSDLRESGSIEQDADTVIFLYRKESEEKEAADEEQGKKVAVKIAKNRGGPMRTFDFIFHGAHYWFEEPRSRYEKSYGLPPQEVLDEMSQNLPPATSNGGQLEGLQESPDLGYMEEPAGGDGGAADDYDFDQGDIPFEL